MIQHLKNDVRPSAYFWSRFQLGCAIALLPSVVVSIILILGFHQFWAAVLPGLAAVGSQVGNVGGLVQRRREFRRRYTTMAWLTFEVELKDPADGQTLVASGSWHKPFDTLKVAREFHATRPSEAADGTDTIATRAEAHSPALQAAESISVDSGGWKAALVCLGLTLLAACATGALIFAIVVIAPAFPVAASALGLVSGAVVVALIFIYPTLVGNRRMAYQLKALSDIHPRVSLVPIRAPVELFAELPEAATANLPSGLILAASDSEIALWCGDRVLTKVFAVSRADIRSIQSSRGHDIRGREWPALLVSFEGDAHLLLFVRRPGAKALWPADCALTESAVRIVAGTKPS